MFPFKLSDSLHIARLSLSIFALLEALMGNISGFSTFLSFASIHSMCYMDDAFGKALSSETRP